MSNLVEVAVCEASKLFNLHCTTILAKGLNNFFLPKPVSNKISEKLEILQADIEELSTRYPAVENPRKPGEFKLHPVLEEYVMKYAVDAAREIRKEMPPAPHKNQRTITSDVRIYKSNAKGY